MQLWIRNGLTPVAPWRIIMANHSSRCLPAVRTANSGLHARAATALVAACAAGEASALRGAGLNMGT